MPYNPAKLANFIIGGTEKAGTTSVFVYLNQHPEVFGSAKKETDFFRKQFTGVKSDDTRTYSEFFNSAPTDCELRMEASPGYLGEANIVAPRMQSLIPDTKLLFILRDPIDRLYSSYNFHVAKLNIPETMSFQEYVQLCIKYDSGQITADEAGLDDWFLKVLAFGNYAEMLKIYYQNFPAEQIKVMFFESLKADTAKFMIELSEFLNIDLDFWNDYEFRKVNVTFYSRNRYLHKLAIWGNALSEPLLRKRPELKHKLVNAYKKLNQSREGYEPIPQSVRDDLIEYYQPSTYALEKILKKRVPESWSSKAIT